MVTGMRLGKYTLKPQADDLDSYSCMYEWTGIFRFGISVSSFVSKEAGVRRRSRAELLMPLKSWIRLGGGAKVPF